MIITMDSLQRIDLHFYQAGMLVMITTQLMKDRPTYSLCRNASDNYNAQPMLVYHSDNSIALHRKKAMKSKLLVMWQSNTNSWVTRKFLGEWE